MDLVIEHEVWRLMQQHFPCEFGDVLEQALASYRRMPGYTPLTRLHREQVGADGIQVLIEALRKRPHSHAEIRTPDYVQLRFSLRAHLCRYLLGHLIHATVAPEPLLEAYLALEVGL